MSFIKREHPTEITKFANGVEVKQGHRIIKLLEWEVKDGYVVEFKIPKTNEYPAKSKTALTKVDKESVTTTIALSEDALYGLYTAMQYYFQRKYSTQLTEHKELTITLDNGEIKPAADGK